LRDDYLPDMYGSDFREVVQAELPDIKTPTIDALELQRHLAPVIADVLHAVTSADPRSFSEEHCPSAHSLLDVRRGVQTGVLDLTETTYDARYPHNSATRAYHDQLTTRYLASKDAYSLTAFDRLRDGIGTAVREPFKFFESLHYQANAQLENPKSMQPNTPDPHDVAGTAKRSWRFIQAISQLDLADYQFLTHKLFESISQPGSEVNTHVFNRSNKWSRLVTYDSVEQRYSLDISPRALGKHAIALSDQDQTTRNRIITTGAERLRCPITRLPEMMTEQYVSFLVDTIVANDIWATPKSPPIPPTMWPNNPGFANQR